ncbi:VOC family protein [Paracoccus fistulariae]|uniref:VOC family protein n=1 Tax=Paracoccus fistulariae TaxID=658446 RepID=A0ABY7SNI8_9RHOB|nr:VOC family protein [Paracoccus fistulariae]MDB6180034.1 VOC family protein [Paracoccus fistulariae]WCR08123.1 VOC family protein [Paracoccus fistulariae]
MSHEQKAAAEPLHEVAMLAATEIYSPCRRDSVDFFSKILGMYIVREDANATYLRSYEDPFAYSLKITDGTQAGPGLQSFRAHSQAALERRAEVLEASGLGDGWKAGEFGHGKAYHFRTPDGHRMKLFFDVDYAVVAEKDRTTLRNRPSKRPAQGIPVRRLDHINLLCSNVTTNKNMMIDTLGFRLSEHIVMDDGNEIAAWTRVTNLVHDVAFMLDAAGEKGRLHHVAFWYGIPQHLMDVAELCVQEGIKVEAGPGKHGISQALFLYVIEPGGNRVELFGDAGYLIFDPTWKPVTWTQDEVQTGIMWVGADLPQDFFVYGTPILEAASAAEETRQSEPAEA